MKRAQSFRDPGNVVMRRRFQGNSGKADEELQSILNRRSRHLEDWEEAMAKEAVTDQEKVCIVCVSCCVVRLVFMLSSFCRNAMSTLLIF